MAAAKKAPKDGKAVAPKPLAAKPKGQAAQRQLLVFDTETTGLMLHPQAKSRLQPRVIEFGYAILSLADGSVLERGSQVYDPETVITAEITKITGLTQDDVRGAPQFREKIVWFSKVFASADVVLAHNLPFDRAIIFGELARMAARMPWEHWPKAEFCTVSLFAPEYGYNPKLTQLYEDKTGKPLAQLHRALADVDALVEVVQATEIWRMM